MRSTEQEITSTPAAEPAAPAVTTSPKAVTRKVKQDATAVAKPVSPAKKAAAKTKTKAAATPKAAAHPAVTTSAASRVEKSKKPKMVRDSFTIPKPEYDVLDVLKLRAAKLGSPIKKTELIRAGIKAIAALSDAAFQQTLQAVPSLKTGRPAKAKKA